MFASIISETCASGEYSLFMQVGRFNVLRRSELHTEIVYFKTYLQRRLVLCFRSYIYRIVCLPQKNLRFYFTQTFLQCPQSQCMNLVEKPLQELWVLSPSGANVCKIIDCNNQILVPSAMNGTVPINYYQSK